jgi:hypothetical protein
MADDFFGNFKASMPPTPKRAASGRSLYLPKSTAESSRESVGLAHVAVEVLLTSLPNLVAIRAPEIERMQDVSPWPLALAYCGFFCEMPRPRARLPVRQWLFDKTNVNACL